MKTKEELNAIKAEYESLNRKLGELTDDEMEQVAGGIWYPFKNSGPLTSVDEGEKDQKCGFFPGLHGFP